jgi:hypothetical protein
MPLPEMGMLCSAKDRHSSSGRVRAPRRRRLTRVGGGRAPNVCCSSVLLSRCSAQSIPGARTTDSRGDMAFGAMQPCVASLVTVTAVPHPSPVHGASRHEPLGAWARRVVVVGILPSQICSSHNNTPRGKVDIRLRLRKWHTDEGVLKDDAVKKLVVTTCQDLDGRNPRQSSGRRLPSAGEWPASLKTSTS